jgi:hypothetical protein
MRRSAQMCVAVLLVGVGCGKAPPVTQDAGVAPTMDAGSTDAGVYVDAGPQLNGASSTYPAYKLDVPQVVDYGGPVLAAPVVVPVFFANDDHTANGLVHKITQFVNLVGGSNSYWSAAVGEYGVGTLTATAAFNSTDAIEGPDGGRITIQDSDIQNWIMNELATDPNFPQPGDNTIYAMHYPAGVTIELPNGDGTNAQSCIDFGGYHSDIALPATTTITLTPDGGTLDAGSGDGGVTSFVENPLGESYVSYAVIPRCGNFGGLTNIDAVTATESHELVEASTDPYPDFAPAYASVDDNHFSWEIAIGGGEVGDMCAQNQGAFTKFDGLAFTVQRIWSNENVKKGHDPCQPELPGEIYFNAIPVLSDKTTLSAQGQSISFESVNVPVGTTKTILMDLYSDADTSPIGGAWDVQVQDLNQLETGMADVEYTLNPSSGVNGNQLELSITPRKNGQYGFNVFFITSKLGQFTSQWVGTVGK